MPLIAECRMAMLLEAGRSGGPAVMIPACTTGAAMACPPSKPHARRDDVSAVRTIRRTTMQ
ncbi:hypothetical protein WJ16_27395 [Burkholderia metallica]|nr:hypothetical protein WJ16_27395 [Burkholderia metallica]